MEYKNFYRVLLQTKHGRAGNLTSYFCDVYAYNALEAKDQVVKAWYAFHDGHVFHVRALRLKSLVLSGCISRVDEYPEAVLWFTSRGIIQQLRGGRAQ